MRLKTDRGLRVSVRPPTPKFVSWTVEWSLHNQRYCRTFKDGKSANEYKDTILEMVEKGTPEVVMASAKTVELFCLVWNRFGDERLFELLKSEMGKALEVISLRDAVDKYLHSLKTNGRSKAYWNSSKSILVAFVGGMTRDLHLIDKDDMDKYLSAIPHPRTRSNHRAVLCVFFDYALRRGWIPQRMTAAELSDRPTVPPCQPEIYTPDEARRILAVASPAVQAHIVLTGFCGARAAEVQRMTWGLWNPIEGVLSFPNTITKTKRRRTCTVTANAFHWLEALKQPEKSLVTVPEFRVNRELAEIHKRLGIVPKKNGWRHSYATYHYQKFKDSALTAKNCGHSPAILESHYAALTTDSAADEWFAVEPENCLVEVP